MNSASVFRCDRRCTGLLVLAVLCSVIVFSSCDGVTGPIDYPLDIDVDEDAETESNGGTETDDNDSENPIGNIYTDVVWSKADGPYFLDKSIVIKEDASLTIDPGTMVVFNPYVSIYVDGTLTAEGTIDEEIRLVSESNYAGGQINFSQSAQDSLLEYVDASGVVFQLHSFRSTLTINSSKIDVSEISVGHTPFSLWRSTGGIALRDTTVLALERSLAFLISSGGDLTFVDNVLVEGSLHAYQADASGLPNTINIVGSSLQSRDDTLLVTGNSCVTSVNGNLITEDDSYVFRNLSPNDQSVTNSWWGTDNESEIQQLILDHDNSPSYGTVDYSGFLSEPVSVTGAGW